MGGDWVKGGVFDKQRESRDHDVGGKLVYEASGLAARTKTPEVNAA